MDEYTFKHCSKGHYYQGEECPYCKAQSTPFIHECNNQPKSYYYNGCSNGHAYNKDLFCCPYCGDTIIANKYVDMITAFRGNISIELSHDIPIKVNDKFIAETSHLDISWAQHTHRNDYSVSNMPEFNYKSKIKIGNIELSGKQFTGLIDFLIDNVRGYKISE